MPPGAFSSADNDQVDVHVTDEEPGTSPEDRRGALDCLWQGPGRNAATAAAAGDRVPTGGSQQCLR
jgi:hypothetical protein